MSSAAAAAAGRVFARDVSRSAGGLSYFGALAIAPSIMLLTIIASMLGQQGATASLLAWLEPILGHETVATIASAAQSFLQSRGSTTWATIIAVGIALTASTGLIVQVRRELHEIWGLEDPVHEGPIQAAKFVALERIGAAGVLAIACAAIIMAFSALAIVSTLEISSGGLVSGLLQWLVGTVVGWIALTVVYRFGSQSTIMWRACAIGGGACAVAMSIGIGVAGWYFSKPWFYTIYGAAGAFVVLLVWLYWNAYGFLIGAEIVAAARDTIEAAAAEQA